jgi:hypothetical protein
MLIKIGKYSIRTKCENCGKDCELWIPRGTPVNEFVKDKAGKCDNCGCIIEFKEYSTKWIR